MCRKMLVFLIALMFLAISCQSVSEEVSGGLEQDPPLDYEDQGSDSAQDHSAGDPVSAEDGLPGEWEKVLIVYEKEGTIFLYAGGSEPQPLTAGPDDFRPLISPDGRSIVYARSYSDSRVGYDGEYEGTGFDYWLLDLESGEELLLISEEMLKPAKDLPLGDYLPRILAKRLEWVDESHKVAFITYGVAHVFNFDNHDLWLADLVDGEVREILPDGQGGFFAFSPDGNMVVVASHESIALLDNETGQRKELFTYEHQGIDYGVSFVPQPVWAEDGSFALVAIPSPESFSGSLEAESFEDQGNVAIWRISPDGDRELLTYIHSSDLQAIMSGVIFSPDRKQLITSLRSETESASRLVDLEGNTLAEYEYIRRILAWSPDSKRVAVEQDGYNILDSSGNHVPIDLDHLYRHDEKSSLKWISESSFVTAAQDEDNNTAIWLVHTDGRKELIDSAVALEFDALLLD